MFCALLTSRYQVSVYRTNGPLVLILQMKILSSTYMFFGALRKHIRIMADVTLAQG